MLTPSRNTVLIGSLAFLAACGGGDGDDRGSAGSISAGISASGILTATLPGADDGAGASETGVVTDGGDDDATSSPADTGGGPDSDGAPKFDIGNVPDGGGQVDTGAVDCNAEPQNPDCMCSTPEHTACDAATQDPFQAMGLNCPGELQVQTSKMGDAGAIGVRSNFGQAGIYQAREGSQYAVIGSGSVFDLDKPTPNGDWDDDPSNCNDAMPGSPDGLIDLPAPLKVNNVGGDCTTNPGLLGTGDCSNTLQAQFTQGGGANDYAELRFVLQVPDDIVSFSYDFAFFSVEYPFYYGSPFNDMYVGWLESEKWTGNISFDQQGNPISLNAGFLEFKDDGGGNPVFAGTCMSRHAGTNWLTTTAGVTPGEQITVVFAIFDLSDAILDSYAFLDNFKWGCMPTGKPSTMPPG